MRKEKLRVERTILYSSRYADEIKQFSDTCPLIRNTAILKDIRMLGKGSENLKGQRARYHEHLCVMLILLAVIALLVLGYKAGRWLETRNANPETRGDYQLRLSYEPTIEVDGVTYRQKKNVTAILLMGIDRDGEAVASGYRNGGQADFLELVVIDDSSKNLTRIQIDRDTMTPITVLGVLGDRSGVRT